MNIESFYYYLSPNILVFIGSGGVRYSCSGFRFPTKKWGFHRKMLHSCNPANFYLFDDSLTVYCSLSLHRVTAALLLLQNQHFIHKAVSADETATGSALYL